MSIFIQFVKDNLAMFVIAIVAVLIIVAAIVAKIIVGKKLSSATNEPKKLAAEKEVADSANK